MILQRQHFLLSYLKTLSVGPVGVSNSRPPASHPGEQPSEPPVRGSATKNDQNAKNVSIITVCHMGSKLLSHGSKDVFCSRC